MNLISLPSVLLVAAITAGLASPVRATTQQSDNASAARLQLQRWLDAYNNADWNVYRAFFEKNFVRPPERMLQDPLFRKSTGGFILRKIEEEKPAVATALLQERDSDQIARVAIEVEAPEPHRILKLQAQAIPRPPELALPHLSEGEAITALQNRLRELAAADNFSGAVLVAKGGKSIFEQAYGLADRQRHVPNTLNTRFRIGSMNKMFTAVAILQLVRAGKVKLDDPLQKYLGDYPNQELASKVTISELLSHTGGTGDFFGPEFEAHRLELRTHEDYVKLFGNRPPKFEPGTKWEYSNFGFLILGAVIDKVSGQDYYDYVRDHVYLPAGMTATGSEPEDKGVTDRNIGYTKFGGGDWQANTDFLPYRGTSAGGGYSTAGDLLRFANALEQNTLLDAESMKALTTGRVAAGGGRRYGYGFEDEEFNGLHCFGHGGGAPGMNGELRVCRDSGYTVVALANVDPPAATRVAEFVLNRLPAIKAARK